MRHCVAGNMRTLKFAFTGGTVQVVPRAVPLSKMVEAPTPLPATNPAPCRTNGKLSRAAAKTLDGKIISTVGPLVIATVVLAVLLASAALVAITITAFGEGADVGEE
jgi:hypothetical protein